ncbi:MAG: hypothetical protein QOH06_2179 [Acidobacteriota bacterium]|jgi:hypothetical protein|nr:hypothetical protein [Acidobacteriota bacterium]
MFYRGSRYEDVPDAEITAPAGRTVRYKRMRFISETQGILPYTVVQGDRLDLVSYKAFRDPEQFWRLCDANRTMRPDDLVAKPGHLLLIPVPMS